MTTDARGPSPSRVALVVSEVRMFGCGNWRTDPGPCPVDDTPHTACTPESVAGQVTLPTRRPRVFDPPMPEAPEFSTKTYRRAVHGRGRRVKADR